MKSYKHFYNILGRYINLNLIKWIYEKGKEWGGVVTREVPGQLGGHKFNRGPAK